MQHAHQCAARVLENAISNHPGEARLHQELGQIYAKLQRPGEAIRAYERALNLDQGDPTLYLLIGQQLYLQQEHRRAEIELKRFLTRAGSSVDPLQRRTADLLIKKIRAWLRTNQ